MKNSMQDQTASKPLRGAEQRGQGQTGQTGINQGRTGKYYLVHGVHGEGVRPEAVVHRNERQAGTVKKRRGEGRKRRV